MCPEVCVLEACPELHVHCTYSIVRTCDGIYIALALGHPGGYRLYMYI